MSTVNTMSQPPCASRPAAHSPRTRLRAVIVGLLILLFLLLVGLAMTSRLDHDENQFVAGGALLARESLLPYRDYPYFHVPYLVYLDAAAFQLTDRLLLAARLVSVCGGFATVAIIAAAAFQRFRRFGGNQAAIGAIIVATVLISNPVFLFTSGRAWNHDVPTLLAVAAFFAVVRGLRGGRSGLVFAAGVLTGLAVGARLTFIPAAATLAIAPFLSGHLGDRRRRLRHCAHFCVGFGLALVPLALVAAGDWHAFWFGNFTYPTLNTAFRQATGYGKSLTPAGKAWFMLMDILLQPGNAAAAVVIAMVLLLAWRRWRHTRATDGAARHANHFELETRLLVVLSLAMLVAAAAPTPLFVPYFHTPFVLLVLLAVYCAAEVWRERRLRPLLVRVTQICLLVALALAVPSYWRAIRGSSRPQVGWVPLRVHAAGVALASQCPRDTRVLTVMPIVPLEGGLRIYPEMAVGVFAMRVGPMLDDADERRLHVLDGDDFNAAFFAPLDQPPDHAPPALLTGGDPYEDQIILQAIDQSRLEAHALADSLTFWTQRAGAAADAATQASR